MMTFRIDFGRRTVTRSRLAPNGHDLFGNKHIMWHIILIGNLTGNSMVRGAVTSGHDLTFKIAKRSPEVKLSQHMILIGNLTGNSMVRGAVTSGHDLTLKIAKRSPKGHQRSN